VHLVLEGSNLEFFEEGSLTSSDLIISRDDLDGVNNFDLTFDNLGLDVKGLEERGLFWVHTSWAGWNGHISGGEGTNFSWGFSYL